MKKTNKAKIAAWALFVILLLSTVFNIYLLITSGDDIHPYRDIIKSEDIKKHIDESLESKVMSEEAVRSLIEEYTSKVDKETPNPVDGEDGRDGIDGKDGADGKDGKSIVGPKGEKGEKGDKGDPGYTPVKGVDYFDAEPIFVQCNVEINAWQQRTSPSDDWELLDDKIIPCTVE